MRVCLFCSSTNLTREHLWPGWIVQALKSKFPPRSNLFTGGILTQKLKTKWPASSIDQRARVVCGACNNGWMSHIEAVTKPVLLPLVMSRTDKRTLNTEELGILARWMTLRSMVSDGLFDEHYFTETDRQRAL